MPRYYFHLRMGADVAPDHSGREFETDKDARNFAQCGAGFPALGLLPSGPAFARHHIDAINEAGQTVFTMPLSEMVAEG